MTESQPLVIPHEVGSEIKGWYLLEGIPSDAWEQVAELVKGRVPKNVEEMQRLLQDNLHPKATFIAYRGHDVDDETEVKRFLSLLLGVDPDSVKFWPADAIKDITEM